MGLELEESVAYQAWNQESEDEGGEKGNVDGGKRRYCENQQEEADPVPFQNRRSFSVS